MLIKKVPLYYVLLAFTIPSVICLIGYNYFINRNSKTNTEIVVKDNSCGLNIKRLSGYQFIKPLLYAEPTCESINLTQYKPSIESVINENKLNGNITTASVYIREFSSAQWIAINEDEQYSPGSLMKIPELIAYYKMKEKVPGILEKKIVFDHVRVTDKTTTFNSKQIELGKSYTIRDLLDYMIVYSDNNATILLNENIDKNTFVKVFTDIGLQAPDFKASSYPMTANNFSIFLKELYNASYLGPDDSEKCLSLLNKSVFKEGLVSGLPSNCEVSHKFGEGGFNNAPQFSESAIVYCGRKPYILTVMTKGNEMKKLPKVISEISKKVYQIMNEI